MRRHIEFTPSGTPDPDAVGLVEALHHSDILQTVLGKMDLDLELLELSPVELLAYIEYSFLIRFAIKYEVVACGKRVAKQGKCFLPKGHPFDCIGEKSLQE